MKKRGLVVMLLLVMMVSSVALAEITHFNLEIPTGTGTPLMDWGLWPSLAPTFISDTTCTMMWAVSTQIMFG